MHANLPGRFGSTRYHRRIEHYAPIFPNPFSSWSDPRSICGRLGMSYESERTTEPWGVLAGTTAGSDAVPKMWRTETKKTGTNGIASRVDASIPPKTTVPSDC